VVHCAARVHLKKGAQGTSLDDYRRVNVIATLDLARQAAASGAQRLVFISSIGVNGGHTLDRPFRADDNVAPHSPYALSKYEAEVGLKEISAATGLEVVIIRPPLVIGPGAPGNFGKLLQIVYRGIPLPLGAIRNRRSVIALDNLVDLVKTCLHHPKAANEIFLVRDAEELSTPALFKMTAEALGRPARLLSMPPFLLRGVGYLTGNAQLVQQLCESLRVDDRKTRELLGWSPVVTTRAALQAAADQFVANLPA
jgi:nucleoside-diphosphate-sugar epimerase